MKVYTLNATLKSLEKYEHYVLVYRQELMLPSRSMPLLGKKEGDDENIFKILFKVSRH